MSIATSTIVDALAGIDDEDMDVHVQVPDANVTYCGMPIDTEWGYVPAAEVTEPAWCRRCVAVQDGIA